MTLFRLDSSIRAEGSVSREIADTLQRAYTDQHPQGTVVHRDLRTDPIGPQVWPAAALGSFTPPADRAPSQLTAAAFATTLADEVLSGDVAVIATPLYNFGVSQHLKTWIDLLLTEPRFAPGAMPLAGRPVTLVIARGGGYGAGTPRAGWDHATPYLVRIFADVWGADVTVVAAELTLAAVNPAMNELIPLAEESKARAHSHAAEVGKSYAQFQAAAA
jgi:FMN-dependent NADH-azoreductase